MKPTNISSRISRMTRLPLTLRYLLQFLAISFLCLGAHELTHHLLVRVTCGAWGEMSFWNFQRPAGCGATGWPLLATLAGPLLTWLLIWGGRAMILHGEARAGVTLILANLPLGRLVTVLMRGGDEMVVARAIAPGNLLWIPVVLLTLLLLWSPLVTVWRVLAHRHRLRLMAAFLVLPLFWDMLLKRVWLASLLEHQPNAVHGIPVVVLTAYAVAILLLALLRRPTPRQPMMITASGKFAAVGR
jgi:hypothetical protein